MTLVQIVTLISGVVAIIAAIVAVAVHITKLQSQIRQSRLEEELNRIKERYSDLEEKHQSLLNAGAAAFTKKKEIDAELSIITDAVKAGASSILVPVPSTIAGEEPAELVFLSLIGPGAPKLQGTRTPMTSIAGSVFASGKAVITHGPQKETSFSDRTDKASGFTTEEMIAIPLMHQGTCCGVAEFLNKKQGAFDADDQQLVERLTLSLAVKVSEFARDPNNAKLMGVTPRGKPQEATILFSDLSNSSVLNKSLDVSIVVDLFNEYFEALCSIALSHGATIDKFMGDGFMLTFNVPRSLPQHEVKAVVAALEMQKRFEEVKRKWSAFQYPGVNNIYNRIGVTCGPVFKAEMGHSQYRQITLMGDTVNMANSLCELGDRNRNIIVIGEALYRRLPSLVIANELRPEKARDRTRPLPAAYEVVAMK